VESRPLWCFTIRGEYRYVIRRQATTINSPVRGSFDPSVCLRCQWPRPAPQHKSLMITADGGGFERFTCAACSRLVAEPCGQTGRTRQSASSRRTESEQDRTPAVSGHITQPARASMPPLKRLSTDRLHQTRLVLTVRCELEYARIPEMHQGPDARCMTLNTRATLPSGMNVTVFPKLPI